MWVLYELGSVPNIDLITKKLAFYGERFGKSALLESLHKFKREDFILDMKPFVTINERTKLSELFDYITKYLEETFEKL